MPGNRAEGSCQQALPPVMCPRWGTAGSRVCPVNVPGAVPPSDTVVTRPGAARFGALCERSPDPAPVRSLGSSSARCSPP